LFLRDGEACLYETGMSREVIFTEQDDGRADVESITPLERRSSLFELSTGCPASLDLHFGDTA